MSTSAHAAVNDPLISADGSAKASGRKFPSGLAGRLEG